MTKSLSVVWICLALSADAGNIKKESQATLSRRKTATDLGWKVGDSQGDDDGEFFREEIAAGEDPRGREARGTGLGG